MRVLFVENHAVFAQIVRAALLAEHEVVVVASAAAALARLGRETFDVLLVDYDLDDEKGTAVVGHARAAGFTGRIVAVSAHAEGNARLLAAGADVACPKLEFGRLPELLRGLPGK